MAYTPDYSSDDLVSSIFDGLAKGVIVVGSMAGLVALVVLYKWGKRNI